MMARLRLLLLLIPLALPLSLTGCIGSDMSDLYNYIEEVKARPPKAIEPLPQVRQVETFVYEPRGRRDPFSPTFGGVPLEENTEGPSNGLRPDPLRRKEELEQFPLDTLRMVGTLKLGDKIWGLIQSQDGVIHRVQPGNHAGLNYGQITQISEEKIELTEIVPDGNGGYQERQALLTLSSPEEQRKGK